MPASARCASTHVYIQGLNVEAYIGVPIEERKELQTVVVDICLELVPDITKDSIEATSDYAPVGEEVRTLGAATDRKLIETFAQEIADLCFARYPAARTVTVGVKKPNKLPGCDAVGTTRTFTA